VEFLHAPIPRKGSVSTTTTISVQGASCHVNPAQLHVVNWRIEGICLLKLFGNCVLQEHVSKDPVCDLSPIFTDYQKHYSNIEDKYGSEIWLSGF